MPSGLAWAGWALVNQGYGSSRQAAVIKLQYELYYIKHQSLCLDLVILLKTVVDSFALRGRWKRKGYEC
jgi:lipopolysaccharide/colanic/teichoic acid biosynthesis glycosyltransferase